MKNFKDILFMLIVLIIVVLFGYWAVVSLESGSTHVEKQKQQELEQKNQELEKEVQQLKDEVAKLQPVQEEAPAKEDIEQLDTSDKPVFKYQSLIDSLQKLIDDKILIREKSSGTRVGTIQTFLNIYNNTSNKIDNDYGKGTKTSVINFQKAEGLTADGEISANTLSKMIDWLKEQ